MRFAFVALATLLAALAVPASPTCAAARGTKPVNSTQSIYDFKVQSIDGKEVSLAAYRGKTLLIVNTASHCGFTRQYESLQSLYKRYSARGFVILGFPANNFMGQEPGSNEEIQTFCSTKFKVSFPLFAKISVKGKDIAPLYTYLTHDTDFTGAIPWNFTKFLVNPEGKVVARFDPATDPLEEPVLNAIEPLLAK